MKFWLNSDGKAVGGKIYFAVVEEEMVDKNGVPVEIEKPAQQPQPVSVIAPEQTQTEQIVSEPQCEVVAVEPVQPVYDERLNELAQRVAELSGRVETIIDIISRPEEEKQPAPVVVNVTLPTGVVVQAQPEGETTQEQQPEVIVEEEVVAEEATTEQEEVEPEQQPEEVAATQELEVIEEERQPEVEVQDEQQEVEITDELLTEELVVSATDLDASAFATQDVPAKKDYVRSPTFAEKMMVASEVIQDRYDELKNYALRYRKLKARISKKFDSINQGRCHFVKLSVAGKTLKLYLNMDINTVDPKFRCHDMSDKKTYVTVPVLLRIKSGRAMKYAKILIDQCAEQHGMLERRKPFVVDSMALVEEALRSKNDNDVTEEDNDVAEEIATTE